MLRVLQRVNSYSILSKNRIYFGFFTNKNSLNNNMSNAFTNFLTGSTNVMMRDYQHASRLYVDDTYARAPKLGFLYFIQINLNPAAILKIDKAWATKSKYVGLLAKKADLPKFNITTETLNQYNRKTVVQTKLNYSPISIELHDDNSDITHKLWTSYFKYYYADSNQSAAAFTDTKYGVTDYSYGLYNNKTADSFIESIDLFVLHQGKFTQYTLVNPKITNWEHDNVNQADGSKILQNKMNIIYENVYYKEGSIIKGRQPHGWTPVYYDNTPSPLSAGNTGEQSAFSKIFDIATGNYKSDNLLLTVASGLTKNYINKYALGKLGPIGYNIANGVLGVALRGSSGSAAPGGTASPGIFTLPGGVGINIFKGFNTSVDGKVRANPAAVIFPKSGPQ